MKVIKYISKGIPKVEVEVYQTKKDTTIQSPVYGPILITEGNYVLKYLNSDNEGLEVGITKQDLDMYYEINQ